MLDTDMSSTCIQGGSVRAFNGYQSNNMMHPPSPHTAWQFTAAHPKQEPRIEEEKNDSGINSGSDFQSSSPGSDNSQDLHPQYSSPQSQNPNQMRFYSTPLMPKSIHPYMAMPHFNHNPLTPPNSEPLVSPKSEKEEKEDITLTPCASPSEARNETINADHLRRLEMSLEKSGLFSSKVSEGSIDDENKSDNDVEEYDENNLRVPRINSHGKVKTFKCKQCNFVALTKLEFWNHNKVHIKEEKQLTCPKCPFVTEYKHHLEYHLRNHTGSKPFKCNKCEYSCVNKSMLNSHMKSHSNIYRYRCIDCTYATKYCHSLKIHLRKYKHNPDVVLDSDGTPCPDLIIDVHGTRRGPKTKNQGSYKEEQPNLPFSFNHLMANAPQQIPFPPYPFFNSFPNPQLLQNFQQLIQERQALAAANISPQREIEERHEEEHGEDHEAVLDLSKPGGSAGEHTKSRRKGPAFKLDHFSVNESDEEDDDDTTTMFNNVEAVVQNRDDEEDRKVEPMCVSEDESSSNTRKINNNNNVNIEKTCQHCNISFGDDVLYTMHMGYHGFKNPFSCNMCGVECVDKVAFFLHIARTPHS